MKLSYFLPALIAAQGALDMCECQLNCVMDKCLEHEDTPICFRAGESALCANCKAYCLTECGGGVKPGIFNGKSNGKSKSGKHGKDTSSGKSKSKSKSSGKK